MSEKEIIERLDALTQTVAKQQEEIRYLQQQLEAQKTAAEAVSGKKEAGTEQVAAKETEEKKKPEWTERVQLGGDLRLRYEGLYNREQRQTNGSTIALPTRDQYRIRARVFVDGKVSDEVSAHFMLCTNQDTNKEATTTNQSLTDDFNDKGIYLHRAYGTYKPHWLEGLELTAGKFKNTFLHTDIMWDPDVNPEGIYERYQYQGWKTFQPFVHLGQMVVNEVDLQTDDAALYIYQGGFDWKIGPVKWTLAGSYYDWANLHNSKYLHTADYRKGGGNTFTGALVNTSVYPNTAATAQYKYDYNLAEAITYLNFKAWSVPVKLTFDYIKNTDGDVPDDKDTAYYAGFTLGQNKQKGDMSLDYKYARIERDAVIGSMNDQDFYGANRKGHKVTFSTLLLDKLMFQTAYFYTDPVTAWVPNSTNWTNEKNWEHEERLQGDFILSF
ncbi:MAG: putative porin [Desulfobacterales bacterium]|uniref:Putative porin n=1 Tax=Candidatus Desulfatibia profunda TaxID=2841695 RepID=A0A8J6TLQ5_9BACT|nr:putative porin [Candidatus Desulfatibia profunda]MBL7180307.1 putative porin [Desulfobacterales bacterium]